MVWSGATDVAIDVRSITRAEIPLVRSFLARTLPMSAHVAGIYEAVEWSGDVMTARAHGVWIDDDLQAVVHMGQVLRVVTTTPELPPAIGDWIADAIPQGTRAVMGPEDSVHTLHRSVPGSTVRHFVVWDRSAEPGGAGEGPVARVRPPAPAELPAFAVASFNAFREELGFTPTDHPHDLAYRELWERARQRGRIVGAWDEAGRCIFRVEIRPALGMVAELRGLWLDPALRGAGMGRALLDETVAYITSLVVPRVQVIADTQHPVARSLYRSAGFDPVGRLARLELPRVGR